MPEEDLKFRIHSTKCIGNGANAYLVKEKILTKDENGNIIWKNKLKLFDDPKRTFYITKPGYRVHKYKKEFEELNALDRYQVRDSEMLYRIDKELNGWSSRRPNLRHLCNSPYLYGADIDTGVFIRHFYNGKTKGKLPQITVGSIDIENEVRGEKRINVFSFNEGNQIYTAYLKEYLMKVDENKNRVPATQEELVRVIQEELKNEIKEHNYQIHLFEAETELDLITWIFQQIHKHKTDFVGVWNLNYDIPKIIERLRASDVEPKDVMCPKELPDKYKYVKYKEDTRKCEHFADKWHWLSCTGYTQFIDSMCLYARLRKAKGRESSYTLDAIANKILGDGKMKFGKITNHYMEQMYNFMRYVAYNIKDTILIPLMELQTKDCSSLLALTDVSLLSDFSKQTTMGKNSMYFYNKERDRIIATAGEIMGTPMDDLFPKLGGTVLPPSKAMHIGIHAVEEFDRETQVTIMVNDEDVASEYPSAMQAFNIAKETKLFTAIDIEGFSQIHTEDYFSNVTSPKENSVYICHKFFGLPNYQEMGNIIEKKITEALIDYDETA